MKLYRLTAALAAAALTVCPAAQAAERGPFYVCAYYAGDGSLVGAEAADPLLPEDSLRELVSEGAHEKGSSGVLYRWDDGLSPEGEPIEAEYLRYAGGDGTFKAPHVTDAMCKPEFWISKIAATDEIIMTPDEIEAYNRAILDTPATNTFDLAALPEVYNGTQLAAAAASFASPVGLYLHGEPVSEEYYEAIRENIRNADVSDSMELRYAVGVNRTVMKAYPYADFLSDSPTDMEWDDLVSAPIYVNEPLAAYITTGDGRFTLVKSQCCSGWVATEDIAVCESKEQWKQAAYPERALLVTGERVYLEPSADPDLNEKMLPMSTVLELVEEWPGYVENRLPWNNYVVKMPARDADGKYSPKLALIPANRDVCVGYLPYTQANVITQAMKELGNRYGWGGMMSSNDCSSFAREIYRCFGIELPRNTTWQGKVPTGVTDMSAMTDEEKAAYLDGAPAGTILIFPGHEVVYIGSEGGYYYSVNDVSGLVDPEAPDEGIIYPRGVILNDLSTLRANHTTWLHNLTHAVEVK